MKKNNFSYGIDKQEYERLMENRDRPLTLGPIRLRNADQTTKYHPQASEIDFLINNVKDTP